MPHAFDPSGFKQLLEDAEHLFAGASEHERRLAALVDRLEGDAASGADDGRRSTGSQGLELVPARPRTGERPGLLATMRELCVGAREQRLTAATILKRVVGDLVVGTPSTHVASRVLVVDDSQDSCDLAAVVLELSGFHVITAANGLEGILLAHLAQPAVVLMDINMPVLNGIEAARLLKASTVTRDLQVIAYTARPDSCHGPVARLFVAVLEKPSSPEAILASVQQYVPPGS